MLPVFSLDGIVSQIPIVGIICALIIGTLASQFSESVSAKDAAIIAVCATIGLVAGSAFV